MSIASGAEPTADVQPNAQSVQTASGDAAADNRFAVSEYRVLGNSVLPGRDIERILYPLLGPDKRLADVEAARAALEKLYHDRGFGTVFIDIPPQDVSAGIVRLRVTEGRLHASKVDGAKYFSERDIAAAVPAAQVGTVPNLPELQQQLAAVNASSPDRSVVPILKAGPVPGTVDLELKVDDKLPLHGSVSLDDNYSAFTKPLRTTVALSYGNLFGALDDLSLQYQASPQRFGQVGVFVGSYTSRPFWDGYRLSGTFIDSNSNVDNVGVGASGVLGVGQIITLRLSVPPLTTEHSSHGLALGVDYKHFRDSITIGGGSAALVTPISYTNASFTYSGAWHFSVVDGALTVSPNFGIRGVPNNTDQFESKRFLGRPNYVYVRWDASANTHLPAGFGLYLRLAGQETNEPLISNEDYSIGGVDGVRGYLEAEELGDRAIKGTIQGMTPTWSWLVPRLLNAFAFFDDGRMHLFSVLANQPDYAILRSWGAGLNLLPGHPVNGVLTWADPLTDGSYTRAHQWRLLFAVHAAF
ncbi:MAG TPA: POTRA domain-containing protein [Steroidobacteraceae bacterium]|jgi:hemolysin activation/secretion protein|nr:POTRA domain-containing protein [Steroidobacteraceae bacterium]